MSVEVHNFADVRRVLSGYMSEVRSPEHAYTLERIINLMEILGNPQDTYRVVHVAGTSGKTSTAYYIAAMLWQAGKKVGLTVSPHIDEVNERVQINGIPLPERQYVKAFNKFLRKIDSANIKPTYFELLVAFAYWYFAEQRVDYAVVEVGLGGLLDGTNVMKRSDKVCVVTDIGYDHIEVLGRTLGEIAAQKAGIIGPHNKVFCYQQNDEVMAVIRDVSSQQQAELHEILPLGASHLPENLPLFQRRNWYLAYMVYQDIAATDGLSRLNENELANTTSTYIPARMEIVRYKGKTIILDGAHNAQKLETLAESVRKQFPHQSIAALVSFAKTKQSRAQANLDVLDKLCDFMIFTSFATAEQERVSITLLKLAEKAQQLDDNKWEIIDSPAEAFQQLLKRPEKVLLVTGSFFLLNHIRPILFKTVK